ncbi:hypothetical protein BDV11DRAFT_183822 [Aspergillus similis]
MCCTLQAPAIKALNFNAQAPWRRPAFLFPQTVGYDLRGKAQVWLVSLGIPALSCRRLFVLLCISCAPSSRSKHRTPKTAYRWKAVQLLIPRVQDSVLLCAFSPFNIGLPLQDTS